MNHKHTIHTCAHLAVEPVAVVTRHEAVAKDAAALVHLFTELGNVGKEGLNTDEES